MSPFRGWLGEKKTTFIMWLTLDKKVYQRFHNIIIPSANSTTQIDHLLISPYGLFVIETKNFRGWIYGSQEQANWTQVIFGNKYRFQNPLRQNFRHTKCLSDYLDIDHNIIHSVILFVGDCKFKTEMPPNVMQKGLGTFIRRREKVLLSDKEIKRIVNKIRHLQSSFILSNSSHVKLQKARYSSETICPKCQSPLVKRTVKKGQNAGTRFFGCSAYPKCRYTKNI